jgi:outer membrane protein assembly factor BamE (lipoprotein component of BamABCDE complex)
MGEAEKKAFFEKLETVRRRESYDEVVKVLGSPFSQNAISAKKHDRPLGTRLTYYVRKLGDGVNERYDQSVTLDFDNDKKLVAVRLQNLADLLPLVNESACDRDATERP